MNDKIRAIDIVATAGSGALGDTVFSLQRYQGKRLTATIKNTHATVAITDFSLIVKQSADGPEITLWTSTDWADATKFKAGDAIDTDANGHYPYQLSAGESCRIDVAIGYVHQVGIAVKDAATGTATATLTGYIGD